MSKQHNFKIHCLDPPTEWKETQQNEKSFGLFGDAPESAVDLRLLLERHFPEVPAGIFPVGGLLGHLRLEGTEALQWWSDHVSPYVHTGGSLHENCFLLEGDDGQLVPAEEDSQGRGQS